MMEHRGESETGDYVSIHIKEDSLVSSIKEKMEDVAISACISKVPDEFRSGNYEKTYIPDKVSIGPFHHGKPGLKDMEDQKWRYLFALLNRKQNLEASLDRCVELLRKLEHRARRCYSENIDLTSDEFVQIMLVDGCFIIELFLKFTFKSLRRRNDIVFSTPGMRFELRRNMVLLENQIPYFVLQRLFEIVPIPKLCSLSLNELAFRFFRVIIPAGDKQVLWEKFNVEGTHLLDLMHHCFAPSYPTVQSKGGRQQRLDSATRLQEAGIRFKKATTRSLLDVKFVNGVLEIPPLEVDEWTETILGNLIALEQLHSDDTQHITSYAFLFSNLLLSKKDVKLLSKQRILIYDKEKEKEVSELFRKLSSDWKVKDVYYKGLFEQAKENKRTSVHLRWQKLKHNRLSLLVYVLVILILLVTVVGAFFSVLSFCLHHI
ncbi:hypothetical protein CJ030_MR5G017108 [Morella rubra]|uniref:Uncharacterized protein n=1 Tax=Morella rubra TaxID=262757 RepID=A0A6A1VMI3_9ROSI|nr:hypothetical protein CJ030_MR5G017108 [Morella rubra]